MIYFHSWNTHFWDISSKKIQTLIRSFQDKRKDLGFIDVNDKLDIENIKRYVDNTWKDFDTIIILGIGWSALGTKALLESIHGKYYNENKQKTGKNIYVLDNIDPETFSDIEAIIDIDRSLFIFVSKSGWTIETLSEYLYFREQVQKNTQDWQKHFCFIVWENCTMKEKLEKDFQVFYIPENIWGRFSVFTAVGLLPIAFSGTNITLFFEEISKIKENMLSDNLEDNVALSLALTQYYYYNKWKNITVFFPYSSRMFQVGEWYKQLIAESIGKQWEGITLTSSLGVTDQHSQLQLYQDGPKDKFFITLGIEEAQEKNIAKTFPNFGFKKLLDIEKYGTETSLQNQWHPLCNLSMTKLDEKNLAQLLYIFMLQVAFLGELFKINAFHQPGVEKSKIITKQKLTEKFGDLDIFVKAFYE